MNPHIRTLSELNIYPDLVWLSGWAFGFDPLSSEAETIHNGTVFQTLTDKGVISGPDQDAWKIQFHLPHKSHAKYFSNGFIIKRRDPLALIASPAPNVLCGFISKRYGMELVCEHTHNDQKGTAHFHSESGFCTLLRTEHDGSIYFSLALDMGSHIEADKQAAAHLTHTPEDLIPLHECRRNIIHLLDSFSPLNTLPAIAAECLLRQMRVPEGALIDHWPASPALNNKAFSLNELYPLLTAWCDIDVSRARKMYDMALNLQRQDGHFPVWVSPSGDRNSFDAPHLFFARCTDLLLTKTGDLAHAKASLSKLNNYMRWCLRHYFPQNALHPAAQSAEETLVPELWHKEFTSAEHTIQLICELDALAHLHRETDSTIPIFITQALDKLTALFDRDFWNPQTRTFSTCYTHEERVTRYGLHEYLPLLYQNLASEKRNTLLAQFKLSTWANGFQPDPLTGVPSSPATPFQQFVILQCIKHPENPAPQTRVHINKIWSNLNGWQNRYFNRKKSAEMPAVDTAFICLLIDLQALRMAAVRQSAAWQKWMRSAIHKLRVTKEDLMILIVFIFITIVVHAFYENKTETKYEATLQDARASYIKRDANETSRICQILLKQKPENKEARLLLANLLLAGNAPKEAEKHYRKLRELDEDNPAFLLGLAMALHRQGHPDEANKYYLEFQTYFAPYFPETSKWVTRMQNLDTPILTTYFIRYMVASNFMLTL